MTNEQVIITCNSILNNTERTGLNLILKGSRMIELVQKLRNLKINNLYNIDSALVFLEHTQLTPDEIIKKIQEEEND